eukprot:CAMPEP_0170955438 /NCGR_PEP_ID=MMETSP0735-20130129/33192_1 /TAXON_ID=186038 /ORGANISM="Fragilariopsis kerguelensis, Strain L26-C5" /LENGTH=726 /DNA_ID=CAMNT_0011367335 /DNA_START=58 /DNA_END=2238 /DNA_ORIENTATION=+
MNGIIAITDPMNDNSSSNNKNDNNDDYDDDDNAKGNFKVSIQRLALYDEETTIYLQRAYELAEIREKEEWQLQKHRSMGGDNRIVVLPSARTNTIVPDDNNANVNDNESSNTNGNNDRKNIVEVSSDDDENALATIVSEDENESDDNKSDDEDNEISSPVTKALPSLKKIAKETQLSGKQQKRLTHDINRHASNLKRIDLPVGGVSPKKQKENNAENTTTTKTQTQTQTHFIHLFPAAALLSKDSAREPERVVHQARSLMSLSERLSSSSSSSSAIVVVLLMQSGRFAGGVFRCGRCLSHRATTRYTVRKGQGKAQSAQDSSSRVKSVGSQLRRAGEQQLNEDVRMTLNEWTEYGYLDNCSLILLACPKTMRSTVFSANIDTRNNGNHNNSSDYLLSKNDDRIRKIPFDVGRATYMNVKVVYTVMMGIDLREVSNITTTPTEMVKSKNTEDTDGSIEDVTTKEIVKGVADPMEEKRNRKGVLAVELPLTKLHEAARDGNLVILLGLLNNTNTEKEDEIDQSAGYECMTPLHFAAASSSNVDPTTASALVSALLIQGHADPTIHDACGRPPYFVAEHDKIREAFRKARAVLGEDYWDWESSKVGPPLTEESLEARKIKEVEKKRRKKARQKEKKALDKVKTQEAENQLQAEREAKRAVEEAKRVRDGLSEKPTGVNVCDFCHKSSKGRNARQNMFRRLDYKYCSSNCVNEHKRELMAAAAMARFGGG